MTARPARSLLAVLAALLALAALASPALADTGHKLGGVFAATGKCKFTEPGDMAVDNATGETFLYDRATNAIDSFTSTGACVAHRRTGKGTFGEATNEGLAFDNSSGNPSSGDLYVFNIEELSILKFKFEGGAMKLARRIKTFKNKAEGKEAEVHEFSEIYGMAVNPTTGELWVYSSEGVIYHFSGGEPNEFLGETIVEGSCSPRPGFAIAPGGGFYVGRERENSAGSCEEATAMVRINSAGEPVTEPPGEPAAKAQLDNENTTGLAVDLSTGATKGDVYFDNATSVSVFDEAKTFVQRLGREGEPSQHLKAATGIALDESSNDLFVADVNGEEGRIELFVPTTIEARKPEPTPEPEVKLADNREWEQVTPTNKLGAEIFAITLERGTVESSEDGSAITFSSSGPIVPNAPANRSPEPIQNLARRGAKTWTTEEIMPPRSEVPEGFASDAGNEYRYFSPDLSKGLVEPQEGIPYPGFLGPHEPPLSPDAPETTFYWRNLLTPSSGCEPVPSGCYESLVSAANVSSGVPYGAETEFVDATPDSRHVVLRSDVALNSEAKASEEEGLYERGPEGGLELVSVLPQKEEEETQKGEASFSSFPAGLGRFISATQGVNARHAISNDGNRIVWSTEQGLYVRDMAKHETIRLDAAREGLEQPEEPGIFQTANAEGTRIFFTDKHPLVKNASTTPEEEEEQGDGDLYVCELVEVAGKLQCNLTDLTAEVEAKNGPAAVQGVPGASEDGTDVYYVANGIFNGGVKAGDCDLREGEEMEKQEREGILPVLHCNLYEQHFGGSGWEAPKFIATLTTEDLNDWTITTERGGLGTLTSRVSPDGNYLAFMSDLSLTGYDNIDVNETGGKHADEEVYLWNTSTERILCASCNPSGARPEGVFDTLDSGEGHGLFVDRPLIWEGRWLDGNIPGWTGLEVGHALYQSRYLSDSGRLFFNSSSELVPADKNHKADVYEFEPSGQGTCTSATGCVSLISGGSEENKTESAFLDASDNGNDVFLLTAQQLAPTDTDTAYDIYDAHVCSSESPCLPKPEEPEKPCVGEACRPPITSQPAGPAVPATTQPGSGNAGTVRVLSEQTSTPPKPKTVVLTRAQKLAKALKECKSFKKKSKRKACEAKARKKYGPLKKSTKASRSRKASKARKAARIATAGSKP